MKLLFYTHYFPPSVGGVETITHSLAGGIADLQDQACPSSIDVTLVTQTHAGSFDDRALPYRLVRRPRMAILLKMINDADLIHVAGPSLLPMLLGWLLRKPVVVEHHGYQAICPNGLLIHQPDLAICPGHFRGFHYAQCWRCLSAETSFPKTQLRLLAMTLRHWLARRMTLNIAITKHVKDRQRLPRTEVIYYGIELPVAVGQQSTPRRPPEDKPVFAFVGRFVPEKGIGTLLTASKFLRERGHNFELRLIGDGSARHEIERDIDRYCLGDIVTITGFLNGPQMNVALQDAAAVIVPSIWEEAAGLVAIEQMLRGKLVIASAIGGLQEIVGDAGLLFPHGDASALAECMCRVLRDPQLSGRLGLQGRARSLALFQKQRMIREHAELYQRVVSLVPAIHHRTRPLRPTRI